MIVSRIAAALPTLSLALALSPTTVAQELAWDFTFVDTPTSAIEAVKVASAPGGGAVAVGIVRDFPLTDDTLPARVVVARHDENGDRIWNDVFTTGGAYAPGTLGDRYVDIALDPAGDVFLLTSFNGARRLRRYAPDGTLRWVVPVTGGAGMPGFVAMFLALRSDGTIIVVGSFSVQTFPRIDVRALDSTGAQLWRWNGDGTAGAGNPATGIARGVDLLPTGEIVVHGRSDAPTWGGAPRLYAVGPTGSPLWQRGPSCTSYLRGEVTATAVDPTGGLVVATNTAASFGSGDNLAVARFTAAGTESWCAGSTWGDLPFLYGADAVVDALGRVFVAGSSSNGASYDPWILRLDGSGSYLGATTPGGIGPMESAQATALDLVDGDLLLTGAASDGPRQTFVARFAPGGTERWSTRLPGWQFVTRAPDVTTDARGNAFVLASVHLGGVFPTHRLGMGLSKLVEGGPIGASFCGPAMTNSSGSPGSLRALGSETVAVDNVTLRAEELPPGTFTLLLASRAPGSVPGVGGGQGTLCLGGSIGRYVAAGQVRRAGPDGSAALQLSLATIPQPTGLVQGLAGETWRFQAWYRDANPALTSNMTDGVVVLLQ